MRGWRALVLAAAAAAAAAGPGDVEEEIAQRIVRLLETGKGDDAARILEQKEVHDGFVRDACALDAVCTAGASFAEALAREDPRDAPRVIAALGATTADCSEQQPENQGAIHARCLALVAEGRVRKQLKLPLTSDPFVAAASGFQRLHARFPEFGAQLLAAARAFAEGAQAVPAEAAPLWKSAEEALARLQAFPTAKAAVLADGARVLLDRVRWGAARKESGLEARLEAALALVAGARRTSPEDVGLYTAFNEVVSLTKGLGLRHPDAAFLTDLVSPAIGLRMNVPMGSHWSVPQGSSTEVVQYEPPFGRIRSIGMTVFDWNGDYEFGEKAFVKGDSMKDIAGKQLEAACRRLKKVKSRIQPTSASLRQCDSGWYTEYEGLDPKGAYVRRRDWLFKSKAGLKVTYDLAVTSFREGERDDPEFQSVLDSIREHPK